MKQLFGVLLILCFLLLAAIQPAVIHALPAGVQIYELKLGGGTDPKEFVTLYNAGNAAVDLNGWLLEYAKPTFDTQFCSSSSWRDHAVNGSATAVKLNGVLPAQSYSEPIVRQLTDETSGSLRLVTAEVQDVVGWGDAAPCAPGAPLPPNGQSIVRATDCTGKQLFAVNPKPGEPYVADCPKPADPAAPATKTAVCEGVVVSELLPNPIGPDTGKEFIELYNPTPTPRSLEGCSLELGDKKFALPAVVLAPQTHMVFDDTQTGLVLPNSAGGMVTLAGGDHEHAVQYPPLMSDGATWADVDGKWSAASPTPSAANILAAVPKEVGQAKPDNLDPCPAGKYRNPETNRCKAYDTAENTLAACDAGEERSADTNRCRKVSTASAAALTPCKTGQERNPDTNRCRAVAAASTELKPCSEGEERNPETNRCRKVAGATTSSPNTSATGQADPNKQQRNLNLLIVGGIAAVAGGYGIYEYRQDFRNWLTRLRPRRAEG